MKRASSAKKPKSVKTQAKSEELRTLPPVKSNAHLLHPMIKDSLDYTTQSSKLKGSTPKSSIWIRI